MITVEAIRFRKDGLTHISLDGATKTVCDIDESGVWDNFTCGPVGRHPVEKLVDCLECRTALKSCRYCGLISGCDQPSVWGEDLARQCLDYCFWKGEK